ncbi:MAG: transcriptional regulator [Amycolatopsis sp.]|jgi:DNA-binding SARP family transcriptional activator|uniref:AfsR/SARP family transcriptional regulator n=1 Tax=Amycolatopsis sp. TaxID=37632 RepID=UPI002637300B|nr:BTAD domain-containing putative transcriptional regulator [Amycolatopsis sp.]MCU1682711.1 transcriptional regulator [Amycolatopsis sp.]
MTSTARLTLLDGFGLDCDRESTEVPKTLQRLLAFLGLHRQATRSLAVGALWPDSDEQKAFGRLRTALWRLHQLGVPIVSAQGETLRLHDWVRVDVDDLVDTARFVSARTASAGIMAIRDGGMRELLPGWYDDWVLIERERLRQLYLHTVETLAAEDLLAHRYTDALEAALAALRVEPLRESPHRLLMEIHLAEGNYSEALNTYHSYRLLLLRELDVSPSPGMRRLLGETSRIAG